MYITIYFILTRENKTEVTCKNVNTDHVEISLDRACDDYKFIHWCPPLYISVEYKKSEPTTNFRCNEVGCATPDSARFVVFGEQLRCFSGASQILVSITLLLGSLWLTLNTLV